MNKPFPQTLPLRPVHSSDERNMLGRTKELREHVASLKKYPPVPTGAPDPYQPPKCQAVGLLLRGVLDIGQGAGEYLAEGYSLR